MLTDINKTYPLTIYWLRGVFLLVLKVTENERYRKSLFGRKVIKNIPKRNNLLIGNKVYNVIEFGVENINDDSVKKILEINRKKVLKCGDDNINEIVSGYLMDIKPYVKRAIISSVVMRLKNERLFESLCVKDDDFIESTEYFELAKNLRKLSIISNDAKNINVFRNKCYNNWGLSVGSSSCGYDSFLDLNSLVMNRGSFLTINGCDLLVYADESYFNVTENVSELLKFNVPKEYACASLYM